MTLRSGTFDPEAEAALAWCLREATTNVIRHSSARNCRVRLTQRDGELSLEVTDDGHGLEGLAARPGTGPEATPGSGLRGMSERLTALGGRLSLGEATGRRRPSRPAAGGDRPGVGTGRRAAVIPVGRRAARENPGVHGRRADPGVGGRRADPGVGGRRADPGVGGHRADPGVGGRRADPGVREQTAPPASVPARPD